MSPLSFDNGWTDRNVDCCVNIVDKQIIMATNLANLGPVIHEILWLMCMDGEFMYARIGYAVVFNAIC